MVVFCSGPLPDERARVRIIEVKARYAVAELRELLEVSPSRATPFCPVFGRCGGCQLQHLQYAAQLEWKRKAVRDALERIGALSDASVNDPIGMDEPRAYRNKMALVVDNKPSVPELGFYRQRSHAIVPIETCPVVTPQLDAILGRLHELRASEPLDAMLRDARHLVARSASSSGTSVLTVTSAQRSESARRAAAPLLAELPGLSGITNSFELAGANAILGRRQQLLAGDAEIEENIGGIGYRFSASSFFQVNVEMVARLFSYLERHLGAPGTIVDLYCGVGTFALYFAKLGWEVHGVEESARSIAEATENARRNGLEAHVCFTTGRVEELVDTDAMQRALRAAAAVFLDPPRKGSDERTLGAVADARVPSLWYLSCDPATLARDSKLLVAKGYRLGAVQPFDMFPQTGHVETLVHLEYA
jgi:23S rRNA (uracil1939-C5)-methyltransferase